MSAEMNSDDRARLAQIGQANLFLQTADEMSLKLKGSQSASKQAIVALLRRDADNFYKRVAVQKNESETTNQMMDEDEDEIAIDAMQPKTLKFLVEQSIYEAKVLDDGDEENEDTLVSGFVAEFSETSEEDSAVKQQKQEMIDCLSSMLRNGCSGAKRVLKMPRELKRLQNAAHDALEKLDVLSRGIVFHRAVQIYFIRRNGAGGRPKEPSDKELEDIFILLKLHREPLFQCVKRFLREDHILKNLNHQFKPEFLLVGKNIKEIGQVSLRKRADLLVQTTTTEEPAFLLYDWKFPGAEFTRKQYEKKMRVYMYLVNKEFCITSKSYLVAFQNYNDTDEATGAFQNNGTYEATVHQVEMEKGEEEALRSIVAVANRMRHGSQCGVTPDSVDATVTDVSSGKRRRNSAKKQRHS